MYVVYWLEGRESDSLCPGIITEPQCQAFHITELTDALKFCEDLRGRRRMGSRISHITYVCEHPDQVGESGVASVVDGVLPDGTDYTWKKRRQ